MAIHINHVTAGRNVPLPVTPILRRTATPTGSTSKTPSAATDTNPAPSFSALFPISPNTTNVPSPAPKGPPTAQDVFGANPWVTNPTGTAPNGTTYGFNPFYFATQQTATEVAQMVGGKVVADNEMVSGGPFSQNQQNYMVQLPNGGLINPGLVASFYTHGYPQAMVDQMVANEVAGTKG